MTAVGQSLFGCRGYAIRKIRQPARTWPYESGDHVTTNPRRVWRVYVIPVGNQVCSGHDSREITASKIPINEASRKSNRGRARCS